MWGIGTPSPGTNLDITIDQNSTTELRVRNNDNGISARAKLLVGQTSTSFNYMYIEHLGSNFATPPTATLRIANRTVIHGDDTGGWRLQHAMYRPTLIFATGRKYGGE